MLTKYKLFLLYNHDTVVMSLPGDYHINVKHISGQRSKETIHTPGICFHPVRFNMLIGILVFHFFSLKEIPRDLTLEDEQGKHLSALTVFSESINYLRDHLMKQLVKRDLNIKPSEITWVLTVPAIWSDPAKQFMREAAVKVFIFSCNF